MSDTNGTQEKQKAAKVSRKPKYESILCPTFVATRHNTSSTLWDRNQQESSLLQRQCAFGTHTIGCGECDVCCKKREANFLQRTSAGDVLKDVNLTPSVEAKTYLNTSLSYDFSRVPVHGSGYNQTVTKPHNILPLQRAIIKQAVRNQAVSPATTGPQSPRPTSSRTIPARGPNPADCILPLCKQPILPSNDEKAQKQAKKWLKEALTCVKTGASGSNASHASDIVSNEEKEMQADIQNINNGLAQRKPRHRQHYRDFIESLTQYCQRKQHEIRLEFHYNVIFENEPSQTLKWGYYNAEWSAVEEALNALPVEATWANPHLMRFRRGNRHPDDKRSKTLTGGQTIFGTKDAGTPPPNTALINVFQAGLSTQPYPRSRHLGLSATSQTIRHEVGHVIVNQIPQETKSEFFEDVVGWHNYPWSWITNPQGRVKFEKWAEEYNKLKKELKFDDSKLNSWLKKLKPDEVKIEGEHTYVKRKHFLHSYKTSQVPTDKAFEYARTDQIEYLTELYTLAVSRPEFLHSVLPKPQIIWLKSKIFHTPEEPSELAKQYFMIEPLQTQFLIRGNRLFTREQLDALMNVLIKSQHRESRKLQSV